MEVVDVWTGRHANALRQALRLTNEGMAQALGTSVRTIAKWNAQPDLVPVTELQRALDTALSRAPEHEQGRFSRLVAPEHRGVGGDSDNVAFLAPDGLEPMRNPFAASAELRLTHDPVVIEALDWIDEYAGWTAGDGESRVRRYLREFDIQRVRNLARKRSRIHRSKIVQALTDFYDVQSSDFATYRATLDEGSIETSVLTRCDWLDLGLVLGQGKDQLALDANERASIGVLAEPVADAAAARIADILATDTRLVNTPLYQLRRINLSAGTLTGTLSVTDFTTYALTMDLLERETLDAIVGKRAHERVALPLREHYLPTVDAVTNLGARLCAGGALALFAAARPGSRIGRGKADYVLLIQQRSDRVLNAAGRLAVIPKAFHEPLVDFSDDAQLSATLERELEEELFGRTDVDNTQGERRVADPFHISRLSDPMRWLIEHNDAERWRMECTGFGLNLVSGNFEFACLIIIEDEEWWARFGGHIEANWETEGLRRYSSLDRDGLTNVVHDGSWSNEGIFAFLEGLRRLGETGGRRVSLPSLKLEV